MKLAIFVDKSLSTKTTRVTQPTVTAFDTLLVLLEQTGIEVAVGLIRDESNRPLLRCRLEPRPLVAPLPSNAFLKAREVVKRRSIEAGRTRRNQERLAEFRRSLEELLSAPVNAHHTDIFGALHRGDLFLDEPEPELRQPFRRFLLLESDGMDNVRKAAMPLRSGATILLVNGSDSVGNLAFLHPIRRFESLESASRFLVNTRQGDDDNARRNPTSAN